MGEHTQWNEYAEIADLHTYLSTVTDLQHVQALLHWDQATYLPQQAGRARGRQLAVVGELIHQRFTSPDLGRLLDGAAAVASRLPSDDPRAALVRVTQEDYARAVKVPTAFMAAATAHFSESYSAWATARAENDFAAVRPYLERTLDLSREYAAFFPDAEHPADPLIDDSDRGFTVAEIRPLFARLRDELAPLVAEIAGQDPVDTSCLEHHYPEDEQWAFGLEVLARLGYDFARGRQDKTHHPFMIRLGHDDCRITTRVNEHRLDEMLFSTIHECGHAFYEMGTAADLAGTPLDQGTSAGVHESQSRLWENMVARSRPFWTFFYPQLQACFPAQLGAVDMEEFYRAINAVRRSLIRTDADEVTYNLHVITRFELELQMLEGALAIADLPDAWHAAYDANLGIQAPSDVDGVLQDVHWYAGFIGGAFQGYTLGNVLAAQFFAAARQNHPEILDQMANGEFSTLYGWLQAQIYRHGRAVNASDLVVDVTGSAMSVDPYLAYLREKYGEIYG